MLEEGKRERKEVSERLGRKNGFKGRGRGGEGQWM